MGSIRTDFATIDWQKASKKCQKEKNFVHNDGMQFKGYLFLEINTLSQFYT